MSDQYPPADGPLSDAPAVQVQRVRFVQTTATQGQDVLAREEPLEIRVAGVAVAVVMRTPGHDLELVRGFLLTERVIESDGQLRSIRHCDTVPDPDTENNVVQAVLEPGVHIDLAKLRRNMFASSSCGLCGKATIEQVMQLRPALLAGATIRAEVLHEMPGRLQAAQTVFEATGGLHAAGLFHLDGTLLCVREDVGRHNAVDKVIGWAAAKPDLDVTKTAVMVSGRLSYEITHKALTAGIPILAGCQRRRLWPPRWPYRAI